MSTGADCVVEEREPGKWWYRLQCYPYGATEEYEEDGPFRSEEAAMDSLHRNHANPGGYSTIGYEEYSKYVALKKERDEADKRQRAAWDEQAAKARKPKRPTGNDMWNVMFGAPKRRKMW